MTIEEFAEITRRVIARDSFDDFLPTACYPARRHVTVLQGIPASVDVERAAFDWALRKAISDEEFLVAFRLSPAQFKVIRRSGGDTEEAVYDLEIA